MEHKNMLFAITTLLLLCCIRAWYPRIAPITNGNLGFSLFNTIVSKMNSTLGHSDTVMGLGINNDYNNQIQTKLPSSNNNVYDDDEEYYDDEESEDIHIIKIEEMKQALSDAVELADLKEEEIVKLGWNKVHSNNKFSLYKRKSETGAVIYLMMGQFEDVSARTFLHSQIDKSCREVWDTTMGEMYGGEINARNLPSSKQKKKRIISDNEDNEGVNDDGNSNDSSQLKTSDVLYYRTKWPWPLKDRDYALARRCKIFEEEDAIVFISKSTEADAHPIKNGVIRVDNYWCHSTFLARPKFVPVEGRDISFNDNDQVSFDHSEELRRSYLADLQNYENSPGKGAVRTMAELARQHLERHRLRFHPVFLAVRAAQQRLNRKKIHTNENSWKLMDEIVNADEGFFRRTIDEAFNTVSLNQFCDNGVSLSSLDITDLSTLDPIAYAHNAISALYRQQLYRRISGSKQLFDKLHERYHPKHLIKASMLARTLHHDNDESLVNEMSGNGNAISAILKRSPSFLETNKKNNQEKSFFSGFARSMLGTTSHGHAATKSNHNNSNGNNNQHTRSISSAQSLESNNSNDNSNNSNDNNNNSNDNNNRDIDKELAIDKPGMQFVTIFCDDQKVPLPSTVVDILSKQGEKLVPGSVDRLHKLAIELENNNNNNRDAD